MQINSKIVEKLFPKYFWVYRENDILDQFVYEGDIKEGSDEFVEFRDMQHGMIEEILNSLGVI